jgi:NADH-quinone oxidoreductase subunit L
VALLGWWLAYLLYHKRQDLPQKIADALGGFYQTVVHKYYIDELYAVLFVKPLVDGSTRILWQGVDRKIIDAAVNDAGDGARHVSDEVRHMQSGNIRSYAGWIAAGSAVVIAFMIWMWVGAR